jgi:hypothetical protein
MSNEEQVPPGMSRSEWIKSEAFALRDAGRELDDEELQHEAMAAGYSSVREKFREDLQAIVRQNHSGIELPPIEDDETLIDYSQRVSELIREEE